MNATIRFENGVAVLPTQEPSKAEMARRLELFEIALREERIAELERTVADLTDKLGFQCNEVQREMQVSADLARDYRHKIAQLQLECQQLQDITSEYEEAGNALADEREQLRDEVERLTSQLRATSEVGSRALDAQRAAERELKRLRELDPDGLKKRLEKHKRKAAELDKACAELRAKNHALTKANRKLDAALDKACADINAGMELKPERVFAPGRVGRWELFTCQKDGWYQLLDTEHEVSQTVRVEDGELITPKVRPVPKAIAAEVLAFHQEHFGGAE